MNLAEPSKQDEFLKANINNMVNNVCFKRYPKFSCFLDDRQRLLAVQQLKKLKYENYMFFGGTQNCERVILGVFPDDMETNTNDFPIVCVKLEYSSRVSISHRDCLGALMGLQIDRSCVGDIIISGQNTYAFVSDTIADFIVINLNKVGKVSVQASLNCDNFLEKTQEYELISGTVSSLRLDCIISLITSKSRSSASQLILSQLVKVNYCDVQSISYAIKPNDVIVIRGKGKFIVGNDIKLTKKNRFYINVNKLV